VTAGKPPPRGATGTGASVKGRSGNAHHIARRFPLDQIRVGKRHRKELGDVAGLAASIEDIGLLHPIVVTPDGQLIAGARRLAAFTLLGKAEIPATAVDLDAVVRGEFAENMQRKMGLPRRRGTTMTVIRGVMQMISYT
jgi:hypothetical protein